MSIYLIYIVESLLLRADGIYPNRDRVSTNLETLYFPPALLVQYRATNHLLHQLPFLFLLFQEQRLY